MGVTIYSLVAATNTIRLSIPYYIVFPLPKEQIRRVLKSCWRGRFELARFIDLIGVSKIEGLNNTGRAEESITSSHRVIEFVFSHTFKKLCYEINLC